MSIAAETEQIVLLDDDARPIGAAPKLASHHQNTPLHLAFSVYIFNDKKQLLVTRRALHKKVWPGVWTNSCCGHPAPNEEIAAAIARRVQYELGMKVDNLRCVLPDYRYTTPPFEGIIENEVCPVYVATANSEPHPNPTEVDDAKWISWQDFCTQTESDHQNVWSWWSKDQAQQLKIVMSDSYQGTDE